MRTHTNTPPLARKTARTARGFTLIEMMVAFTLFAVIMVIAVGSLLALIEANHKAQTLKTVVNNLHFALENMSRNIRTGSSYHCGAGTLSAPADCPTTPSTQFVFRARDGEYVMYRLSNGEIIRSKHRNIATVADPNNFIPITAPEIVINALNFYVDGADSANEPGNNKEQPRVLIVMKGTMQGKSRMPSRFDIQTLVSQRLLDI